jgi:5-methylcytosine-specific restriction endonuclease McrA
VLNPSASIAGVCPLCGRTIPPAQRDAHHLVPKSKGGRQTTFMHRVCHRQIHAVLTETELARHYATVEALLEHPELKVFVSWVKTKPEDFFVNTSKSARVRKRQR